MSEPTEVTKTLATELHVVDTGAEADIALCRLALRMGIVSLDEIVDAARRLEVDQEVLEKILAEPASYAEEDQAGIAVTPTELDSPTAPHVNWRRPADDIPVPGRPVLACYRSAPALVYVTPGTLVWADWTTGIEEPILDFWAELPPTPEEDL